MRQKRHKGKVEPFFPGKEFAFAAEVPRTLPGTGDEVSVNYEKSEDRVTTIRLGWSSRSTSAEKERPKFGHLNLRGGTGIGGRQSSLRRGKLPLRGDPFKG